MNATTESAPQGAPWLLLVHHLPPKPDYFRVKVRRRLHRLDAFPLKSSVYVLPNTPEALEDFQWLQREIVADGGEAVVCEASFVAGIENEEIAMQLRQREAAATAGPAEAPADGLEPGRTWVTRQNVFVDRIASAWLIRRYVDPKARFKFVPARGYRPAPGEVRFDMYQAEYTHDGDRCTFETLLRRFRLRERALRDIAEIVHDIDYKDEKFERPEAAGVAAMLRSIALAHPADDDARLGQGAELFEGLLRHFQSART